ncbi:MAG: diguanylate cyclase [Thiomicrorhabdus sp.]|nr:MAG: diguanylate cyclase [Thiomicrorhabdus sp.]
MKDFTRERACDLSRKQSLTLFLSCIVIAFLTFVVESSNQLKDARLIFNNNISSLIQLNQQNEKRTEILLDALSHYYEANLIKSSHEFEYFAKGLYDHTVKVHTIGFANYLPKEQKLAFEKIQQMQGFESFQIRAKGIFLQEKINTSPYHLAVSMITPLEPELSIFLSEDLFSIDGLAEQFYNSVKSSKSFTVMVNSTHNQQLYSLTLRPIYLNNRVDLTPKERLEQVIGVIFIVQPLEESVVSLIDNLFSDQNIIIQAPIAFKKAPLLNKYVVNSPLSAFPFLRTKEEFNKSLLLISGQDNSKITITYNWRLEEVKLIPLMISITLVLLLYLGFFSVVTLVFRYTRHLQRTQNRLMQIITTSQDAVIVTNKEGYIKVWNPVATQLLGFTEEEALGQCLMLLIFYHGTASTSETAGDENRLVQSFWKTFGIGDDQTNNQKLEIELGTKSDTKIIAEIAVSILKNQKNKDDIEISLFIKDITYQRKTEAEIKQLAYFDPLTNLENRTYFKSQVEQYIKENTYSKLTLIFLDLDGFKQVNDSLGHSVGDELLKVISKRIVHTLRGVDRDTHICRFGGDEFVLMLGNIDEEQASKVATRLLKQIERMVKVRDDELQVTGSMGITFYPQHGEDVDTLLRHADTAMYQSKDSGKNTYSIYNDEMEARLSQRLLIEKHLRNALRLDEFSLVYQPKLCLSTGLVVGVEALLRWKNPVLGDIPPDKFISIAEESNLIINIGNWVAECCIQQLINWQDTQFKHLHIAINVSSQQLQHPYFLESISQMMADAGLPTNRLEIELTERTIMSNAKENILRFSKIREQGFELSVDDFGTGYSSLSYLKRFPLSILKIDKGFVDGLPFDEEDVSIAKAILNLAHNLNMRVVAEGVETLEQIEFLRGLKCNYAQGYYISRPLSINILESWLDNHTQQNTPIEHL